MRTKDLEAELGLSKHTIHYYEKEGFIHPQRDQNGYRNYSEEDVQILHLVKFLRNMDISIDDVKAVLSGKLDFYQCLEVNQVHVQKQIDELNEVHKTIEYYKKAHAPLIPALYDIKIIPRKRQLGFQKTTDSISLGRRLTRPLAFRKWLVSFIPTMILSFIPVLGILEGLENNETERIFLGLPMCFSIIFFWHFIFIAADFQISMFVVQDIIDHCMNQSVEFLEEGIYYHQYHGFFNSFCYFYNVLLNRKNRYVHFKTYEEIEEVTIMPVKRFIKIGTPISSAIYIPDFIFTFKNGEKFHFMWPMTLDNEIKLIAYIIEAKVECIHDEQNVLYALKNDIDLTEYLMK